MLKFIYKKGVLIMSVLYTRERKICYTCGYFTWDESIINCPLCNIELDDISYSDGKKLMKLNRKEMDEFIETIVGHKIEDELVKKRYEYKSKEYVKQKEERDKKEYSQINAYQQEYLSKHNIECPYCHSTNTSKIGTVNRMISTGLFGLASKKIGKQWHCNNCKSDF